MRIIHTTPTHATPATEVQAPKRPDTPRPAKEYFNSDEDAFENLSSSSDSFRLTKSTEAFLLNEFDHEAIFTDDSDSEDFSSDVETGVTSAMLKAGCATDEEGNYTLNATRMQFVNELAGTKPGETTHMDMLTAVFPHLNECVEELRKQGHTVTLSNHIQNVTTVTILKNANVEYAVEL